MQVGEELHLHLLVGELLHPHPQEGAQVAHEAGGACGGPTGRSAGIGSPPRCPQPGGTCPTPSLPSTPSFPRVLTSTSALQELQPHVDADGPGQGVPGSTLRQLVHWGDGGTCRGREHRWVPHGNQPQHPAPAPGRCSCQVPAPSQVTCVPPPQHLVKQRAAVPKCNIPWGVPEEQCDGRGGDSEDLTPSGCGSKHISGHSVLGLGSQHRQERSTGKSPQRNSSAPCHPAGHGGLIPRACRLSGANRSPPALALPGLLAVGTGRP